ncbi:Transposase IS66 family protein [Stieleria neptunia]|uniref:Transposase IS66 family protein n=1 Tax=Stieleria neptunia TaxID=2527979 RepID=A0A518I322_9BACT|nr:IS66 family transposase [Stieleria neptunia]QDV47505.1 Transposase IS66 family protein [Stieleria neptunia]
MTAPENQDELQSLKRFNDELVETVQSQQKTIAQLREELNLYRRKLFGQSSERHAEDDSQLHLFDLGESVNEGDDDEQDPPKSRKKRRRKKKSEKLPAHLRRKIIEAGVSSKERMCSCCGEEMPIIGTDISERLDLIPAELFVWEIRRHKRACGKCRESIAQVPAGSEPGGPATPVAGSDSGFGVYTQIITNKFADHLPLYRGEDIFARAGVMIPRNTQFGMLVNIAALVAPLIALMKSRIVSGRVLGVDDTSVRLQDPALPGKMRTARFWLYRGREDHPYNVFDFTESRGRDGPAGFLRDFHGHAVVDAYGVHEGVYLGKHDQIFAACCNCHARRKFVEAKPNDPVAAARALAMYRGLYDVEDRAKRCSAEERLELRQRESAPLMNQLHDWLIEKSSDPRVLPKSSLGKAVRCSLNQWDELTVFLGDGAIPFDNNETENELRSLTIGRQNWLFVGSNRGGEVAAAMYSLVSSAARHHLDAWAYVDDCLRKLAGGSTDYEALLPDVWRGRHPESIRVYRDAEQASRRLTTQQRRVRRREAKVA